MSKFTFLLLVICSLSGCSHSANDLAATLKVAFMGIEQPEISNQKVQSLPYASTYIQLEDSNEALLILGWVEPSKFGPLRLKWVSAGKEMIETESGRIVKTTQLKEGNLLSDTSDQPDPLSLGITYSSTPKTWHHTMSWMPNYHISYSVISTFTVKDVEQKVLHNGERSLLHIEEKVTVFALDLSYVNHYWVEPETGEVVMSQQHYFPGSKVITLSNGKRFNG